MFNIIYTISGGNIFAMWTKCLKWMTTFCLCPYTVPEINSLY